METEKKLTRLSSSLISRLTSNTYTLLLRSGVLDPKSPVTELVIERETRLNALAKPFDTWPTYKMKGPNIKIKACSKGRNSLAYY